MAHILGLLMLAAAVVFLGYAIREYRRSARRRARWEAARSEWLADPTDWDKYRRFLRGGQ